MSLSPDNTKNNPTPLWGPYLSERQWGTVREDYSLDGDAWKYFPFEHAHFRAYQWGEDGLAGISDRFQNLCFSLALWNGKDEILKERLFGLHNGEGNHGEDVKELYYYLDNVPSHAYMEYLYKYPQQSFPYEKLKEENQKRSRLEPEYEILDSGVFDHHRYFDVNIAYAKKSASDICIRINITNRYRRPANITLLPTLWFSRQAMQNNLHNQPVINTESVGVVKASHEKSGDYYFYFNEPDRLLFTNNETNNFKLKGEKNDSLYTKDLFHDIIIKNEYPGNTPMQTGTKFACVYNIKIAAGETKTIYCRLSDKKLDHAFDLDIADIFEHEKKKADEFYESILPKKGNESLNNILRQAIAGLLWNKQFYAYDIETWLKKSDGITTVTPSRLLGRNHDWHHLRNNDVISMPDKWEYPWYAAWDLAFQCIAMADVDPDFAKKQLLLIMQESYMKPDGQLPAYEWNFSDVNPHVHAWAAMEVYKIEKNKHGKGDIIFLKKIFQKLLINFTWWINRKDKNGNNIFEGGFLGLDNIGVFNRSFHGENMHLEQADGTSWIGAYALDMMDMALEIAVTDESFEDMAIKFFEHFILIAEALNEHHLWNNDDKFFYDVLSILGSEPIQLKIKSIVGLTSLYAVSTINKTTLNQLPTFKKRIMEFEAYRKKNNKFWPNEERGDQEEILLSLIKKDRLAYLLERLLDENEFLSPGGIRALSKYHLDHPYSVHVHGSEHTISYNPGDSTSEIFGGNSNWRGPVWIPINFLIIESLKKYGKFYGDTFLIEYPTRSGNQINLCQVAQELTKKVIHLFEKDADGNRSIYGPYNWFYQWKENKDLILFYEYFNGDTGMGLGASHQTGWTALVAQLISSYKKELPVEVVLKEA